MGTLVSTFFALIFFLVCVGSLTGQENEQLESKESLLKEWISEELVKHSDEKLKELMKENDETRAVSAAWETCRRRIKNMRGVARKRRTAPNLAWFLGYIEGKCDVSPAERWREQILQCEVLLDESGGLELPGYWTVDRNYEVDSFGRIVNKQLKIHESKKDSISFQGPGKTVVTLPNEESKIGIMNKRISGIVLSDYSFIASHGYSDQGFDLVKLENATGRVVWRSKVWPETRRYILRSFAEHELVCDVAVHADKQFVYVYVVSSDGLAIEKYGKETGEVVFRFHSALWHGR